MLHHETMETVWNSYNGIAFKSEGDSVGLAFQHPEEAISFCLAAQVKIRVYAVFILPRLTCCERLGHLN